MFLPKYKIRKSEKFPLQEADWYPSGTSLQTVKEMLTSPTLGKIQLIISNLQFKLMLLEYILLDQIQEQSDEQVPSELLGWPDKREADTSKSLAAASSKASYLLCEFLSIAISLF